MHDVIIVGGGPAGLTAALYSSRAMLNTLVLEKGAVGGQILNTAHVENYPGIESIDGFSLVLNMKKQAETFGSKIKTGEVIKIELDADGKTKIVTLKNGDVLKSKSVIIATGARPNTLGVEGEARLTGRGVSYCATCDGAFFRDRKVAVIGGGNSAIEESLFLTKFVEKVFIIHRRQGFRAEKITLEKARNNEKIEFILDTVVEKFVGENTLEKIVLKNVKTEQVFELEVPGVFMYVGFKPNSEALEGFIKLTERGYADSSKGVFTDLPGIFIAGDIKNKLLRQVSTAVGDGAEASFASEKYIEENWE